MSVTTTTQAQPTLLSNLWTRVKRVSPVYPVFIVIYIGVALLSPNFFTGEGIMTYLRRSAPAVLLAVGQLFVLATGGFDLSTGSLVTFCVIGGAMLTNNDPAKAYPAIGILILFGAFIGLFNGFIVSYLKVPSFIVTLGMQLVITGLGLYLSGGSPKGYLTDNFRELGRGYIENLPILGRFPYSVIILVILGVVAYYLFHRAILSRQIMAIGDNPKAAGLSGVKVRKIRIIAFVISGVFAAIAGVLLAGYGGVNIHAGDGLELAAISACVLGGTALGGGRGSVPNVMVGALSLEALFSLLNFLGLPKPLRDAIQGVIIIGAVAYGAIRSRQRK